MGPSLLERLSWPESALKGIPAAAIGPARASVRMDLLHVCGAYANCSDCGNTRAGGQGRGEGESVESIATSAKSNTIQSTQGKPGRETIREPSQPGLDRVQNREGLARVHHKPLTWKVFCLGFAFDFFFSYDTAAC